MSSFVDPPCSLELLHALDSKVFARSYYNECVNIVAFPGSGKTLELRYLIRNEKQLASYSSEHIFGFIDLSVMTHSVSTALTESLIFIKNNAKTNIDSKLAGELEKVLAAGEVSMGQYLNIITGLVTTEMGVTVIIDNAYLLFSGNEVSYRKCVDFLLALRRISSAKVSFIFINSYEFNDTDITKLGTLGSIFVQYFVFGREIAFDSKSAYYAFSYQEKWNKAQFSDSFKAKAAELTLGDPSTLRIILTRAVGNTDFQEQLCKEKDLGSIYKLIGEQQLDHRFNKITKVLKPGSLKWLKSKLSNPSDYLINTGLVIAKEGERFSLTLPLFAYYIEKTDLLTSASQTPSLEAVSDAVVKDTLSGQELILFRFLETKVGEVIVRDSLAQAIWGSDWEQKYSDWAIDQIVSRIRSKLKDQHYSKNIKTIKGKGFIYS